MIHIRVDDRRGLYPELTMDCPTCKSKKSYIDYYDHATCNVCGRSSDDAKGRFMSKYRRAKKIKRRDMAKMLNIKPNTLTKYEFEEPSKIVFDRFMRILKTDMRGKIGAKKQKQDDEYKRLQSIYTACEPIILFPQDDIGSYTENTQDTNSQSTEYFSSSGGDFGGGGASSDYSSSDSDNNGSGND